MNQANLLTANETRMYYKRGRSAYKKFHGSIPDGCQIHHVDGDITNNEQSNLLALSNEEHSRLHNRSK